MNIKENIVDDTNTKENIVKKKPMTEYMRLYMKNYYTNNPIQHKHYRNSINTRKKYIINDETWAKYGSNLHSVVSLKEIIDEMPTGEFEKFLMEYKGLHFEKKI
jgi:hypothetical protein